ncbi:MAG: zinc ribbon domain-containing protein, partial [Erysipelotrichaceae bacterium]|nr:zinc ribbon domain-containing protein [Erysipelotrichaceae bacterium]
RIRKMICTKCEYEIPEGTRRCPYCGTVQKRVKQRRDNAGSRKTVALAITAGVLIAAITLVIVLFLNKPVKPSGFINVTFDDVLSGYSSAHLDVSYSKLDELIGERRLRHAFKKIFDESEKGQKMKQEQGVTADEMADYCRSSDFINVRMPDPGESLGNGDEVVVLLEPGYIFYEYSYGEDVTLADVCDLLKISLPEEYRVKVQGLTEAEKLNLMSPQVSDWISFEGVEGQGTVKVSYPDMYLVNDYQMEYYGQDCYEVYRDDRYLGSFDYIYEAPAGKSIDGLSEGDSINIKIVADDDLRRSLLEKQITLESNPVTVKVTKLEQAISGLDALGNSDITSLSSEAMLYAVNHGLPCNIRAAYKTIVRNGDFYRKNGNNYGIVYVLGEEGNTVLLYQSDMYPDSTGYSAGFYKKKDFSNDDSLSTVENALNATGKADKIDDRILAKTEDAFIGKTVTLNEDEVRVRMGPGTDYQQLEVDGEKQYYSIGSTYTVIDVKPDSSGVIWFQVEYQTDSQKYKTWVISEYTVIE